MLFQLIKRIVFSSTVFYFSLIAAYSQTASRIGFFIGYGYYEGINAGTEIFSKDFKNSFAFSAGSYLVDKKRNYFAIIPEHNIAICRSRVNPEKRFIWYLNNKLIYWQLEDDYYKWKVISIVPSLKREYSLKRNLKISIDAGPCFNIVLYNERKTFMEVGWPYHVLPNIRVRLII